MAHSGTSFEPGKSGNKRGRPPGKSEIAKRLSMEKLAGFLAKDFDSDSETGFIKDWVEIGAIHRMKMRANLYDFIMKRLSRAETTIDVSRLTDSQIDELLDSIRDKFGSDDES